MGGLGNQMFQAAHALAHAMKLNREAVFLSEVKCGLVLGAGKACGVTQNTGDL